jgi:tetratricopeptide (TPR) repeat protein
MRTAAFLLFLFAIAAQAQEPSADELLKGAIREQQQGQYQAAIRDYRKVLQLRPDMVEAKVNLGAALAHVGEYDDAIATYQSALPSLPPSFKNPVLLNLGLAYYKKGDFANAHDQFLTLHRLQPGDARVALLLGDTDLKLKKPQEAVALLEPMDAANSQNMDFQYVYGSALIGAGRRREGVARIEKVAESKNLGDAYLLAGASLLQLNEYDQARRDLEAALQLDPRLPNIYTLVGTARDKTGDAKDAEPAFREALKINPDDFDANLYLGAILYKRREMAEAKIYLERALKLNPTNSLARYEAAMLKSTAGEYDAAAQELEKLVKDDPEWLDPHVELASLYYKLHRTADGARERQIVERLRAEEQSRGPGK